MPAKTSTNGKKRAISWLSLARSAALIAIGILILLHESFLTEEPNRFLIGIALVLLGLPIGQAIRNFSNGG